MRVLITGISGFVGRHLTRRLIAAEHEIWGMVVPGHSCLASVRLVEADLTDAAAVREAVERAAPDAVIHLGALSQVGASWKAMARYYQVNVEGTAHLLDAARDRRILFASSAEVYGLVPEEAQPIPEHRPIAPQNPYGLTKAFAEHLALEAGAVVVRSFNLIGPGQSPVFALPSFAKQLAEMARGESAAVLRVGNLAARRDFTHVQDAADGWAALLSGGESGRIYNLGSGEAYSLQEVLERLIAQSGLEPRVEVDPQRFRPVDQPLLLADAGRLRKLGWEPSRDLDGALAALWDEARGGEPSATSSLD